MKNEEKLEESIGSAWGREMFCKKEKLWKGDTGKGIFQDLQIVLYN